MKNKVGRPTKYEERFCEELIEASKQGLSHRAFCGKIGISPDTFYRWQKEHERFSDSIKVAKECLHHFWEDLGLDLVRGKVVGSGTAFVWMTKNVLKWRDHQNIDVSGELKGPQVVFTIPKNGREAEDDESDS